MIRLPLSVLFVLAAVASSPAQTLRPTVASVWPTGGQRGTAVTVTLSGVNLGYGTSLLIDCPGIAVDSFKPEPPPANAKNPEGKAVAQLKIGADTTPGRYPLRVLTPFGPSDTGYFVVGEWPEGLEKEPNNSREQAQPLACPVTVVGRSDGNEDVDVFRVTIARGETMVFSAAAGSIGSSLAPILTLRDAAGHERAFAAALRQGDAVLTFTAPEAGDYFLILRDLRYQGGPPFFYRLTVGKVPAINAVFPLGGVAGTKTRLALSGANLPTPAELMVALPGEPGADPMPLPDIASQRLEVSTFPEVTEVERNDRPEDGQRVSVPVTINGRIWVPYSTQPDVDCFRFSATKGQAWTLEMVAARLGSPLDAVLAVLDAKGKELISKDDERGRDPIVNFVAPETGEYIARVSDLTGHSGENFGYRLHIGPTLPDFQLAFSPDCPAVGPGDRIPLTVTATRQNGFDGEIALAMEGLPPGMHLIGNPAVARGQNSVTLFATADSGSAIASSRLQISGKATIGGAVVVRRARSNEEFHIKVDDRVEHRTKPVPLPVAAVAGPPDLIVAAAGDRVTLNPGKTVTLKVIVQRRADFVAKIPIVVQGMPAGVSVTGNEIPEKANEATLTFKAEGNAALGDFPLIILGRSVVDELRFTDHATIPVTLTVAK